MADTLRTMDAKPSDGATKLGHILTSNNEATSLEIFEIEYV